MKYDGHKCFIIIYWLIPNGRFYLSQIKSRSNIDNMLRIDCVKRGGSAAFVFVCRQRKQNENNEDNSAHNFQQTMYASIHKEH